MVLPEPTFSFTIPSLHDDTPLDCRIYRPNKHGTNATSHFRARGAVIAHPYAPLGGSYDDHVVGTVGQELLQQGITVGTFNFRGAGMSKGRTSWTGRPELDDYISFAGFLMHYLDLLELPSSPDRPASSSDATRPAKVPDNTETIQPVWILLGGYSYGSLIVTHLPSTKEILHRFATTEPGSAASEIVLRARNISAQSNSDWESSRIVHAEGTQHGHKHSSSTTMGGEETRPEARQSSREKQRNMEGPGSPLRKHLRSLSLRNHHRKASNDVPAVDGPVQRSSIRLPHTSYLLVSPILPPLSMFAAPMVGSAFWRTQQGAQNILHRPTLALFGDRDSFTSIKKLTAWSKRLEADSSPFSYEEIHGAGHFWHERGAEERLRAVLRQWVRDEQRHVLEP